MALQFIEWRFHCRILQSPKASLALLANSRQIPDRLKHNLILLPVLCFVTAFGLR